MADVGPWTVRRLLEWTSAFFTRKQVDSPRLSAELLLSHVLEAPRLKLYTDYDRALTDAQLSPYRALVQRAAEHEPIAYLTGRVHFFNLELEVTPAVLIPRPDTETLVENVLQSVRNMPGLEAPRILDLCTGSGCIALALASRLKSASVVATDVSQAALDVAKSNADRLKLGDRVLLARGDLYAALKQIVEVQPFDLLTANPPYIPTATMQALDRNIREYEPEVALDGGLDGLVVFRRIIEGAAQWLSERGTLFVEIAFDQGIAAVEIVNRSSGLTLVRLAKDQIGHDRVVIARRSTPAA